MKEVKIDGVKHDTFEFSLEPYVQLRIDLSKNRMNLLDRNHTIEWIAA